MSDPVTPVQEDRGFIGNFVRDMFGDVRSKCSAFFEERLPKFLQKAGMSQSSAEWFSGMAGLALGFEAVVAGVIVMAVSPALVVTGLMSHGFTGGMIALGASVIFGCLPFEAGRGALSAANKVISKPLKDIYCSVIHSIKGDLPSKEHQQDAPEIKPASGLGILTAANDFDVTAQRNGDAADQLQKSKIVAAKHLRP